MTVPWKRRVEIGQAVLLLGDCLDILPTLPKVDAVITDPPYGQNHKRGGSSRNSISTTGKVFTETIIGDEKPFDPSPWLLLGLCCFTGAHWFYDRLPAGGGMHVWNKRGPYLPIDQADGDLIWISKRTNLRIVDMVWRGLCRTTEHTEPILHPTQKPISLMRWCIEQCKLKPGSVILDPYAGSCTIAVAAAQMGFPSISIEIEPRYFEIGIERITNAYRQQPMFPAPPAAKPEQAAMFDKG